jgi:hypothetical protein
MLNAREIMDLQLSRAFVDHSELLLRLFPRTGNGYWKSRLVDAFEWS